MCQLTREGLFLQKTQFMGYMWVWEYLSSQIPHSSCHLSCRRACCETAALGTAGWQTGRVQRGECWECWAEKEGDAAAVPGGRRWGEAVGNWCVARRRCTSWQGWKSWSYQAEQSTDKPTQWKGTRLRSRSYSQHRHVIFTTWQFCTFIQCKS